jgi:hypothetical protein
MEKFYKKKFENQKNRSNCEFQGKHLKGMPKIYWCIPVEEDNMKTMYLPLSSAFIESFQPIKLNSITLFFANLIFLRANFGKIYFMFA